MIMLSILLLFATPLALADMTKEEVGALIAARHHGGARIHYSVESRLQKTMERLYSANNIKYSAFVAIEPSTGRVLSLVSRSQRRRDNLALQASFPAASVFKVITAAAALESGQFHNDSRIPVRGEFHTLLKRDVLAGGGLDSSTRPRFARLITLEDALAHSVNSVFGKLGIFGIGGDGLLRMARRFGFDTEIPFELPVESDHISVPEDPFGLAAIASGFSPEVTLSPLHAALIAATVANGGVMMEPSIVERVESEGGQTEYSFQPTPIGRVLEETDARELGLMMHRTVTDGTSRRHFTSSDDALSQVFIAGKTGTLYGPNPKGLYDWFVGFAEKNGQKIAVAVMTIHGSRYGLKASRVARVAFESWFAP
jgi:cell division protein FtsI/penicillin-binding protein 2